jgi:hypothetical protein
VTPAAFSFSVAAADSSGGEVGRGVGHHQVAAGGKFGQQPADQVVRAVHVGNEVQQGDQGERDRPVEVQDPPGAGDDRVRIAHVRLQVLGRALRCAAQQGRGVGQHDRVVVAVDDPGLGRDLLGDLVQVRLGGDAGADVQELPYALLGEPRRDTSRTSARDAACWCRSPRPSGPALSCGTP